METGENRGHEKGREVDTCSVERRVQFCARCGRGMFEYFRSPDGHFGLVDWPDDTSGGAARRDREVRCPTCGARYRLLDRLNPLGQPVARV